MNSHPRFALFSSLVLLPLLSGCMSPIGDGSGQTFAIGAQATYRLEYMLGDDQAFLITYEWAGSERGRTGDGATIDGIRIAVAIDGQPTNGGLYDPASGILVSDGQWAGYPRAQGFAHAGPLWPCYPGLLHRDETGVDFVRAVFLPIHCIWPRLHAELPLGPLAGVGLTAEKTDDAWVVRHADGMLTNATIEHRFASDGGPLPTLVTADRVDAGASRPLWRLERTEYRPSRGEPVPPPSRDVPLVLGARADVAAQAFSDAPPHGGVAHPFPLADAVAAAKQHPTVSGYLSRHPDAYLVRGLYRHVVPEGPTGTERYQWHLTWGAADGARVFVEVRRQTSGIAALGDQVTVAENQAGAPAPPLSEQAAVPMGEALRLAPSEVPLPGAPGDWSVVWEVSTEPPRIGTADHMTWTVEADPGLQILPTPPLVTFSANTGGTINRAVGAPPEGA